jgi:hypothetical protein
MNTKKSILWLLGLMLCATPVLIACSDDDDDNKKDNPSQEETAKYDDLAYFQNAICRIDSLGNLARYNIGEALYESEPEHLYIGVDNIEEATKWFSYWIAPDVELGNITPTTTDLTVQLTDTLGRAQGTIYFKAGSGQAVAEVTYSSETQLKYIDRITFLLNSAWPFNSGRSQWHKGDIRRMAVTGDAASSLDDEDQILNWVLIREGGNGVKPMWCAITKNSYNACWQQNKTRPSSYCPSLPTAKTISDILRSDYSYFISRFKEAGCGELSYTESYWIDHQTKGGFLGAETYTHMMLYSSPDYYTNGAKGVSASQPFLLKIDWLNDGDRPFTVTGGTASVSGYPPENLFDGSCETSWQSFVWWRTTSTVSGKNCWYFEFQSDAPIKPRAYQLWTTNMSGQDWVYYRRLPNQWALYAKKSSRGKWVLLDNRSTTELPHQNYAGWGHTFTNVNSEYQFFRFEVYSHWWDQEFFELGQLKVLE